MNVDKFINIQVRRGVLLIIIANAIFFFLPGNALAQGRKAEPLAAQVRYVPGEVLVKFRQGTFDAVPASVVSSLRHEMIGSLSRRVMQVKITRGQSVEDAVAAYQSDPSVELAQPNYLYRPSALPNDTLYSELWGFNNTAQTITDGPYDINNPGIAGMDMDMETAWDSITDCSSVTVAVLDTGINYTQADLVGNMWDGDSAYPHHGWDFVDEDNDPMPSDGSSHGTHVAGIIGAKGNNANGITGVCWNAELMALRAGDDNGFTTANIVQGIDFAIMHDAKIINMSFGGSEFDQIVYDAISDAGNSGVLVVAAAGNEANDNDQSPVIPCSFDLDNIVCATAVDQAYELATFSNYGATTVDVGAPGVNVLGPMAGRIYTDDFTTGWTMTGGWIHDLCNFGSGPFDMLVNPPDWCGFGLYSNNADDRAYRQIDLSGLLGAGVAYLVFVDLEPGFDFFRAAYNSSGGDPFVAGTQVLAFSDTTENFTRRFNHDLSGCLTATCSFGFQLKSNATNTDFGVGILRFEINTAEPNGNIYSPGCGTSCAAPHVTGLGAMIWAFNPVYTYQDVIASIEKGGDAVPALAAITTTGKVVDAMGSLRYINPPVGITVSIQ